MAEESEGGGGGGSKLILIIVAVIVLGGVGAAVWFFMFATPPEEEAQPGKPRKVAVSEAAEPISSPLFLPVESFIVNLKDGRRYLRATIHLMLEDEKVMEYLSVRMIEVQDIILTELQQLTSEEIMEAEARIALKQRLIARINQLFPAKPDWKDPEPVKKVLFQEFYIQ